MRGPFSSGEVSGTYKDMSSESCPLPEGFATQTVPLTFFPKERPVQKPLPMKLNLLWLDEPTDSFAGMFTRNAFPGAPVLLGRTLLDQPRSRGILINNKVANVGGPTALADARDLQARGATLLGCEPGELFVASTGIIGWSLPVPAMLEALPKLKDGAERASAWPLAAGIMTTDAWPKARSAACQGGRITAVAKGAGMIEPNMATMLVYIMTDLDIPRAALREILPRAVERSFNCISVDSDQSTSDMCLAWASRRRPCPDLAAFEDSLTHLCEALAQDIVRNGEGTAHVMEIHVEGAPDDRQAREAAKAVANSPLVKTAIFGNDPNVGRLLAAVGDWAGNHGLSLDPSQLEVSLGGIPVYTRGAFQLDADKERLLSDRLLEASMPEKKHAPPHERVVEIRIDLGEGPGRARVWGSDLSYEYVRENADYRS